MPVDFVGREIDVRLGEDEAAAPLAFRLGQREYKIAEQLATWEEHAFGGLQRRRDWRQQQRRYYRVRTEEGEVYEIYADWSPSRRTRKGRAHGARWYLHRRLSAAPPEQKPEEEEEPEGKEAEPPSG
jgi:hypothetical protein